MICETFYSQLTVVQITVMNIFRTIAMPQEYDQSFFYLVTVTTSSLSSTSVQVVVILKWAGCWYFVLDWMLVNLNPYGIHSSQSRAEKNKCHFDMTCSDPRGSLPFISWRWRFQCQSSDTSNRDSHVSWLLVSHVGLNVGWRTVVQSTVSFTYRSIEMTRGHVSSLEARFFISWRWRFHIRHRVEVIVIHTLHSSWLLEYRVGLQNGKFLVQSTFSVT